MTEHPIRKAPIHTFERRDQQSGGARYIARFHPYDAYPIFFKGSTEDAARGSAERFRDETIAAHEATFIKRAEGREKARATRAAKEAIK